MKSLKSEKEDILLSMEEKEIRPEGTEAVERNAPVEEPTDVVEDVAEFDLAENAAVIADVKKKKKVVRKKVLFYALFLVVSAAVITGMILFEDRSGDKAAGREALALLGENPWFITIAVLLYFAILVSDTIVFKTLTGKLKSGATLGTCCKVSVLGRYFDKVTPWAIGGEPFQVLYLRKSGLTSGDSCAVTMSRHIIRFFATAVAVIAILASSRIGANVYVMVAAVVSVLGGLIIPSFMLVCAFRPRLGKKISDGIIGLLCKMKVIKNRLKAEKKVEKNVTEFLSGVKFLSKNKSVILVIALCAMVELFANNAVPFFVIRSLGVEDVAFWETFVLCIFVNYSASFVPTPGGSGIAELSFYAIFSAHIGDGKLFWAVLFWRIAVFYIPVFLGFLVQSIGTVREIVRLKKHA